MAVQPSLETAFQLVELMITINPEELLSWRHGDRKFLYETLLHTRRAWLKKNEFAAQSEYKGTYYVS